MRITGFAVREYHDAPIHSVPLHEYVLDEIGNVIMLPIMLPLFVVLSLIVKNLVHYKESVKYDDNWFLR
ncbi:hypothetical protein JCM14036_02810 [Desulfotomaculum defluvii]